MNKSWYLWPFLIFFAWSYASFGGKLGELKKATKRVLAFNKQAQEKTPKKSLCELSFTMFHYNKHWQYCVFMESIQGQSLPTETELDKNTIIMLAQDLVVNNPVYETYADFYYLNEQQNTNVPIRIKVKYAFLVFLESF
jgi:hypothetical protein